MHRTDKYSEYSSVLPEQNKGGEDYVVEKITKTNKGIGRKFW